MAKQFPTVGSAMAVVANSYVAGEQYEKGIEYVERAITIEAVTQQPIPQAWWAKGGALERLKRVDEAIVTFETVISKEPESQFTSLAGVLEDRGDTEGAVSHRAQAAADAELAAAAQGG
jgi:tetratricopeptide (TPR) repeat protein